ncbi:MAG: AI-2E family transporter [Actinomycetota bacterium]|nr:AI-2E family transporter [Actinomycetota bacterium]
MRLGGFAWALLGIAGLLVLGWLVVSRLAVVLIPMLLALFPAALLEPAVDWLNRHRIPRPLATLLTVVVAVAVVGGVFALLVPAFLAQLPALTDSLVSAGDRLRTLIDRLPWAQAGTVSDLVRQGAQAAFGGVGTALMTGLNFLVGLVLMVVMCVCYLTSGRRIVGTGLALLPAQRRAAAHELADRVWHTLGSYTRALFLVALFDAAFTGLGLWLLGVPLVLPLSVLVFFGAFVPYIGAFVAGLVAVLVAFADGGLGTALGALAVIIIVQQIEGNVVQPLLISKVTRLSAFTVIVAVSIGATLLGVLRSLDSCSDSRLHRAGLRLRTRTHAARSLVTAGVELCPRRVVTYLA